MARKSLDSRLDRLMDALLPVGSMQRAEYELPEHLQAALQIHQTKTNSIIARLEKTEPGAAFAALADGSLELPAMPVALRDALHLPLAPVITDTMTTSEAAATWAQYALGEEA